MSGLGLSQNGTYATVEEAAVGNLLTTGQATIARDLVQSAAVGSTAGTLRLTYFTARRSETVTQVRVWSGSTAAAATPTLVRIGLYSVAANGDVTLVASTASDTALFAATHTSYTKAFSASYDLVKGQRYAVGILVVTGAAAPTYHGATVFPGSGAEATAAPRLAASVGSQTDLPASVVSGSLSNSGNRIYSVLLP